MVFYYWWVGGCGVFYMNIIFTTGGWGSMRFVFLSFWLLFDVLLIYFFDPTLSNFAASLLGSIVG